MLEVGVDYFQTRSLILLFLGGAVGEGMEYFLFIDEANKQRTDSLGNLQVVAGVIVSAEKYRFWLREHWNPYFQNISYLPKGFITSLPFYPFLKGSDIVSETISPLWAERNLDHTTFRMHCEKVLSIIGKLEFTPIVTAISHFTARAQKNDGFLYKTLVRQGLYILDRSARTLDESSIISVFIEEENKWVGLKVFSDDENLKSINKSGHSTLDFVNLFSTFKNNLQILPLVVKERTNRLRLLYDNAGRQGYDYDDPSVKKEVASVYSDSRQYSARLMYKFKECVVCKKAECIAGLQLADIVASTFPKCFGFAERKWVEMIPGSPMSDLVRNIFYEKIGPLNSANWNGNFVMVIDHELLNLPTADTSK